MKIFSTAILTLGIALVTPDLAAGKEKCVAIVTDQDYRKVILIGPHGNSEKSFIFPRGSRKKRENYRECAIREFPEETGIKGTLVSIHADLSESELEVTDNPGGGPFETQYEKKDESGNVQRDFLTAYIFKIKNGYKQNPIREKDTRVVEWVNKKDVESRIAGRPEMLRLWEQAKLSIPETDIE